jgi:hypothetical protein
VSAAVRLAGQSAEELADLVSLLAILFVLVAFAGPLLVRAVATIGGAA